MSPFVFPSPIQDIVLRRRDVAVRVLDRDLIAARVVTKDRIVRKRVGDRGQAVAGIVGERRHMTQCIGDGDPVADGVVTVTGRIIERDLETRYVPLCFLLDQCHSSLTLNAFNSNFNDLLPMDGMQDNRTV